MAAPSRFVFVLEQTLGQVSHTRNLERALASEGWIDPAVIHLDYRRLPGPLRHVPGLRTWTLEASLRTRRALAPRLRRGLVDAAFIHTQVASLLVSGLMGSVPTVVSLDATPVNFDQEGRAYGHGRGPELLERLKRRVNQRPLHRAAALVTWSRWAAGSLVDDYGADPARIHVIPPGVDVELFTPSRTASQRGPVRVLFVGGQFERKGGPELFEAMSAVGPGVELDVVAASAVPPAPSGVTVRVHRLAPQSRELVELYRRADIFALPSRGDCMPQAVAEALASGLPVVATRVGAIPEMVSEGVNGHLVPSRQPRALAAALRGLVSDLGRRRAYGARSRALAESAHDAGRNNRAIFALMALVAAGRRPAGVAR
ncbi:MAG: glycosyltransferase family 4 protein [Candidatus Dormibacteraeota bacterium]|nr:glycosyltransferase family 4 protein [Candidatus Dormibacteraeota bacterium]